jgi:hypothetical protein
LALGAQTVEKHGELELENHDRVDGGSPHRRIAGPDQVTHKGEVERAFDVAIEVVLWDEVL